MTNQETITSLRNSRIVAARKLTQRKHRQRQGRFLVEGLQLLHMALDAGARPYEVFYSEGLLAGDVGPALIERFHRTEADVIPVSEQVLDSLSQRNVSQGIVATFAFCDVPLWSLSLKGDELILVLDRLRDPGNLGTLLRVADAAGAAAVAVVEPSVDPFDPQAVRASMGSIFNLPLVRTPEAGALVTRLRSQGLRAVAADVYAGELWGHDLWKGGVALILGNEAQGLSDEIREQVDAFVRLPMVGKAESLNVATAGSILTYRWLEINLQT